MTLPQKLILCVIGNAAVALCFCGSLYAFDRGYWDIGAVLAGATLYAIHTMALVFKRTE